MKATHTTCKTFASDTALSVLGVAGRLTHQTAKPGCAVGLWFKQRWISERRTAQFKGETIVLQVTIRFDDELGNQHNSFAITADGWYGRYKSRDIDFGGCCHDEITAVFPELAGLIRWHLVDSDSPLHYIANTVYWAKQGNLDYARNSAKWPDMPAEFMADPVALEAELNKRLPSLMADFRAAVESTGFRWSPEETEQVEG